MSARTKAAGDVQAARAAVEAAELALDVAKAELKVAEAVAAQAPDHVVAELRGHVARLRARKA